MARASRRKAISAAQVEAEEQDDQEEEVAEPAPQLKFRQQLIGRPGKPVAVAELLKRLKALHEELSKLRQEDSPLEDISKLAPDLAHANVLGNKDKGVQALADFFAILVDNIVPALSDPTNPYDDLHVRVIGSLNEFKSIVLLTDIPSADTYTYKLFNNTFDLFSDSNKSQDEESMSKNVQHTLTGMLSTLVEESEVVPVNTVELLLAQFLRSDPILLGMQKKGDTSQDRTSRMRDYPPAYVVAKNICNGSPERMARVLSQYFGSLVVDASDTLGKRKTGVSGKKRRRDGDSSEDEDLAPTRPSAQDLKELSKAHKLLRELWRSCPSCIHMVMPQLTAELSADSVDIRVLAVETIADLISGIGAAGLADSRPLDPAAYPSQSSDMTGQQSGPRDIFTTPSAPQDFASVYRETYENFLNRCKDKSASVRSAYAFGIGRILMTSAGGMGLDSEEAETLLRSLAEMLQDSDEKVRLAAVQAIGKFDFHDFVRKLGPSGGVHDDDSVLQHLATKFRDRKPAVRKEAIDLGAQLWGVASGAIVDGNEHIRSIFGGLPSKILEAYYVNDPDVQQQIKSVLFEYLVPLQFPPIKDKPSSKTNGASQRVKDSQNTQTSSIAKVDPNALRAERILVLARDLDQKAKTVFFAIQKYQTAAAHAMEAFLKLCEDYNGGLSKSGGEVKDRLNKIISFLVKQMPEQITASEHLWKFAKKHDRRIYHLIRFASSPESEYKKVVNAIKEIRKRLTDGPTAAPNVLTTLYPLVLQASVLFYSRSHVPTILAYSRKEENDLNAVAHEMLREIATDHPDVFKAHVQTMCKDLIDHAPSSGTICDDGNIQTLKACAGFAQKYPEEMPQSRDLQQAMVQYALHGNPAVAAKHAVSIIMSHQNKKDLTLKSLVGKCVKDFSLDDDDYVSRLAALSQIMLLAAPDLADTELEANSEIALGKVLAARDLRAGDDDSEWTDTISNTTAAKIWALKIQVNRLRGFADADTERLDTEVAESGRNIHNFLRKIRQLDGRRFEDEDAPAHECSRLRATASVLLLKLSAAHKELDHMLDGAGFNSLALTVQDPRAEVRKIFMDGLKKRLGQGRLPSRFYAMIFLSAFEPDRQALESTLTWIRARSAMANKRSANCMEYTLARLLSLLAHHPDFSLEVPHQKESVEYILFYLRGVASEQNLPLIYHVAQRCKTVQDAIDPDRCNDNLYTLVDIAQATIRAFAEAQGWQLRAWTGNKISMPAGIFAAIKGHTRAQEIADKQYAAEDVLDDLDDRVRASLRSRKRKHESVNGAMNKKAKVNGAVKKKTTKKPRRISEEDSSAVPDGERRRSTRKNEAKSYKGMDDSESEEDDDGTPDANGSSRRARKTKTKGSEEVDEEVEDEEQDLEEEEEDEEGNEEDEGDGSPDPPAPKTKRSAATKRKQPAKVPKTSNPASPRNARSSRSRKKVIEIEEGDEEDEEEDDDDQDEEMENA